MQTNELKALIAGETQAVRHKIMAAYYRGAADALAASREPLRPSGAMPALLCRQAN